ncbi:MAG TPA: DUF2905 domain-containing protein [Cyclobacteriaceae bacterium]
MGKYLIILGIIIILIGVWLHFGWKVPYLGKLPGDIFIQRKNFSFYFPLATSIILSIILTLILYLINKIR